MSEAEETAKHDLAANLRMLRAYHRMTLQEVADRADLHPDTVGDYEREKGNPRVRTIAQLAWAFNVDPEVLFRRVKLPELDGEEHEE